MRSIEQLLNRSIAEEIIAGYEPTASEEFREEPNPKRFKQNRRKQTLSQSQARKTRSNRKSGARDRKRLRPD